MALAAFNTLGGLGGSIKRPIWPLDPVSFVYDRTDAGICIDPWFHLVGKVPWLDLSA